MQFIFKHFDTIDSTNAYAMRERPEAGTVIYTDEQTAGIGRNKRQWESERGVNIAMSLCLQIQANQKQRIGQLALYAGMATVQLLAQYGIAGTVKWPNDVLLGNRKFAGILVETRDDFAVVGIGMNVNQLIFPESIAQKATSLAQVSGRLHELEAVRADWLTIFAVCYEQFIAGDTEFMQFYSEKMYGVHSWICVDGQEFYLLGVAPSGALRVKTRENVEKELFSGEISFESVYTNML